MDLATQLNYPYLPKHLKRVDKELTKAIDSSNPVIKTSTNRLLKAGGKRLRPSLLLASAALNGRPISNKTFKLATAVELLHIGSLVHDDVIDKSNMRWGIDTTNKSIGSEQAIVVGDYLLAKACSLAAEVDGRSAKIVADTIIQLCIGQSMELTVQYNLRRTQKSLLATTIHKTASLMSTACLLGGLSAGLNARQIENLCNYGLNFGIAFQLLDDLMDLISSPMLLGKPIGNDISEGVYGHSVIDGLKSSKNKKLETLIKSKSSVEPVTRLLFEIGSIQRSINAIKKYNYLASQSLAGFKDNATVGLMSLPQAYTDWAIKNLVDNQYKKLLD